MGFIVTFVVLCLVILGLAVLSALLVIRYRDKIFNILRKVRDRMIMNGLVRSFMLSYLKTSLSASGVFLIKGFGME
jgi:hypothetical protein